VRLNAHNVTWLCAAHTAVELDSWAPTLDDPQRAAFAHTMPTTSSRKASSAAWT